MPKSKRARVVHTSAVQKKPSKEKSASLYSAVQAAASEYQRIFVFSVDNMRNTYLKDVRQHFSDSRLFFGKTKVMAKAFGTTAEDECMPGVSQLAEFLKGGVGLLCTNRDESEVLKYFDEYVEIDFARAGSEATRSFVVPAGVVYSTAGEQAVEDDVPLPHSLEATVRKWGMPTRLDKGKVMLDQEFDVCEEGKALNSNQTALLKLFGVATAEFRVKVLASWTAGTGEVRVHEQTIQEDGVDQEAVIDVMEEDQ